MSQQGRQKKRLGSRSLVFEGGKIGLVTGGDFRSYTNFSMEVVHAVKAPDNAPVLLFGFVYRVRRSANGKRRYITCGLVFASPGVSFPALRRSPDISRKSCAIF